MTFYFENMLSKHSENDKNDFLIFGEGPTNDIDGSVRKPQKMSVLILLHQEQNFVRIPFNIGNKALCM